MERESSFLGRLQRTDLRLWAPLPRHQRWSGSGDPMPLQGSTQKDSLDSATCRNAVHVKTREHQEYACERDRFDRPGTKRIDDKPPITKDKCGLTKRDFASHRSPQLQGQKYPGAHKEHAVQGTSPKTVSDHVQADNSDRGNWPLHKKIPESCTGQRLKHTTRGK